VQKSDLHVVTAYTNFRQSKVRPRLTRQWLEEIQDSGATVCLVEFALGERPYEFSSDELKHVRLIQLRGGSEYEIWIRDAQIMVGFNSYPNARYFCWADADIHHRNNDWVMDTLHMLQHNRVGQTWTHTYDLDPKGNVARNEWGNDVDRSFCAAWLAGDIDIRPGQYAAQFPKSMLDPKKPKDWRSHTGYSWAIRRDALQGIGRLMDWLITGSSDWHMALGFCGNLRQFVYDSLAKKDQYVYSSSYYNRMLDFADKCDKHIRQDIGCVNGVLEHGWHGSKKNRFYGSRESILQEGHFDPDQHLGWDPHGIPYLKDNNIIIRDGLQRLNRMKNEDSVDI
jgi:hypothetical protein